MKLELLHLVQLSCDRLIRLNVLITTLFILNTDTLLNYKSRNTTDCLTRQLTGSLT